MFSNSVAPGGRCSSRHPHTGVRTGRTAGASQTGNRWEAGTSESAQGLQQSDFIVRLIVVGVGTNRRLAKTGTGGSRLPILDADVVV